MRFYENTAHLLLYIWPVTAFKATSAELSDCRYNWATEPTVSL